MKREVIGFPHTRASMSGGILFAGLVLIFSLTSKFFLVFNGITGIFLDLFSEFGYDLNFFGILTGILCGFIFGFAINYVYNVIFWNILKR